MEDPPEDKEFAGLIFEAKEQTFLGAACGGGGVLSGQREVLLGVLFRDDEAVELADIAGRQWLLEQVLFRHHYLISLLGELLLRLLVVVEVEPDAFSRRLDDILRLFTPPECLRRQLR
nr:ap2 erf and b3 domain-containing transcription factor rav1-like protein [Ipomoea trifida]